MKQREWDVWFEWGMLNPGRPRRQLGGFVVWRDGLKVRVEGESTSAVRQVVRQERKPGERVDTGGTDAGI